MREIKLYSGFYDETIQAVIEEMQSVPDNEEINLRINSGGGSVFAGWGLIAEMQKRTGKVTVSIDGNASSMAFVTALYADSVKILSTTVAGVHRAASWNTEDEGSVNMVKGQNEKIKAAIGSRLGFSAFKDATGKDINEIFNGLTGHSEYPIVYLDADALVKIGLVAQENVQELTAELAAELGDSKVDMYTHIDLPVAKGDKPTDKKIELNSNINTNTNMEKQFTQADIDAAVKAERSRVNAYLAHASTDIDKVIAGIKSGEELSADVREELMIARADAKTLAVIANASQKDVIVKEETTEAQAEIVSNEQKELDAFTAELKEQMGLKNEEAK